MSIIGHGVTGAAEAIAEHLHSNRGKPCSTIVLGQLVTATMMDAVMPA
jgi:hypothetical protein